MEHAEMPVAQPNARRQLNVNPEGRKSLFSRENSTIDDDRAKPNPRRIRPGGAADAARNWRANSDSQTATLDLRDSNGSITTPGGTRLPRPKTGTASSHRRPISLSEAYDLAADEDSEHSAPPDASPSPAPRTWHARGGSDGNKIRKMLGADHLDTKGPSKIPTNSAGAVGDGARGSFGKPKTTAKPLEASRELARPGDREKNWRDAKDRPSKNGASSDFLRRDAGEDMFGGDIPDLVPGIEDVPLPSIEAPQEGAASPLRQASGNVENPSPEKSFAWQIDQDFTAGDLQMPDSPRIKFGAQPFANRRAFNENSDIDINSRTRLNFPGSQNTKLDEIRSMEAKIGKAANDSPAQRYSPRQPNTRLEDIRAREKKAEHEIPIPSRQLPRPQNQKLDEIRDREQHPLSNRAKALAHLSDIREQNALSRSLSPNEARPHSSQDLQRQSTPETKIPVRSKSAFEAAGERIPDTPVTVYKNRRDRGDVLNKDGAQTKGRNGFGSPRSGDSHKRTDSRDLLRRLARTASSSPAPESERRGSRTLPKAEKNGNGRPDPRSSLVGRKPINGRKSANLDVKDVASRRTVGFAGLRRVSSTESTKSKRSSMHSEMDPTDRIVGEMALFAPQDNHSERGSVRAPSPESESDDLVEATPKQKKQDPLSMPTPKIMGAYVETPATVRVEKMEIEKQDTGEPVDVDDKKDLEIEEDWRAQEKKNEAKETIPETIPDTKPDILDLPITRRPTAVRRTRSHETVSSTGGDSVKEDAIGASAAARRPRARSLPRRRLPLKNTAKPPSVKDDLLELQRSHNIDDSTLDDLDEVFSGRKAPLPPNALLKHRLSQDFVDEDLPLDTKPVKEESPEEHHDEKKSSELEKSKQDVEDFTRMDQRLLRAMRGTRDAKRGIEKNLEDLYSDGEKLPPTTMDLPVAKDGHTHDHLQCPACAAQPNPSAVAYIHLPVPRLFHRTPHFHLTLLGLVVAVLSLWGAAESAMCVAYCRPETCASPPCVWSFDDPSFGNALPVKVDQWATGGYGREVFNAFVEDAEDWAADLIDAAYGRDMTDVDVDALTFHQKRQYRRRLRKKGLVKPLPESPEQRAKWDAWHQTRLAKERAKEAREMGYEIRSDADESIDSDERVW